MANPAFTGFTTLGDNVGVKLKILLGTTANTQGGMVTIPHGLGDGRVELYGGTINYSSTSVKNITVPLGGTQPGFSSFASSDADYIYVTNTPNNSSGILSKALRIFIWYTP
jgi:hypothetical protein